MRKVLCLALAASGLLLFACLAWHAVRSDQPYFRGKSLYAWLLQHAKAVESRDQKSRQEAEIAIHHIGTNALPTLLVWISKKDTPLRKKILTALGERGRQRLNQRQAQDYHALTTYACGVLKSVARPMVPDLAALLKNPDPFVRASAAFALDQIGPSAEQAIPALLETLADKEAMGNVMQALKDIGAKAEAIVAVSVQRLCTTNADGQMAAMWALAQCGTNANVAIPTIRQFLVDPDLGVRMSATNALNRIAPQSHAEAPPNSVWVIITTDEPPE